MAKMAEIKTIYKGESVTLLFTFPEAYDMTRLASHKVFVGETEFAGVVEGQAIKMQLKSSDTDHMIGTHRIVCLIDDTTLGLRKPYCGELVIAKTQASGSNASVSNISDIIIPIVISETAITVGDILYNYTKGDKGDPFTYSDFTPEQIAELQQPAADAIASIGAVEQSVEQAEALRVTAEQARQTNTATAIQNAENATTNASNAAILANEKAGLANNAAILANEKAGLADTAATQANTARDGANSAAQSATNLVNSYATDLAAKVAKTDIATQVEAEANTENTKFMTALRVFQNFVKNATTYVFSTLNTTSKTITGAINELFAKSVDLESLSIRKLVLPLGATYNTTTKLYSLNGLTDITEEQMINIYNYTAVMIKASSWNEAFNNVNFRTNIQGINKGNLGISANYSFTGNAHLEVFKMNNGVYISNTIAMFGYCPALREVNLIYMQMTLASQVDSMFQNCAALVTCNLRNLKVNLSFAWSPLLSLESLQYIIQSRGNGTTPITITVHPTVFAKLTDNTNYPTWYAVNQDALTKYITFASA